jgi:hypothetical protein
MLGLKKICLVFSYKPNEFFFWCNYEHGKKKAKKKGIMSYVVMFGYGRGPTHCNAHTWMSLRVGLMFFREPVEAKCK